jgi:hypothetical protein
MFIFNKILVMKREKALKTINELPSEFNLDELIDRLIFIEKVEKGNQQIKEGKTKSHQEVKELAKKWSK